MSSKAPAIVPAHGTLPLPPGENSHPHMCPHFRSKVSRPKLAQAYKSLPFFNIYLFIKERGWEGEREGEECQLVASLTRPLPGTGPATQACALTGNGTGDPSLLQGDGQLSHTGQGTQSPPELRSCLNLVQYPLLTPRRKEMVQTISAPGTRACTGRRLFWPRVCFLSSWFAGSWGSHPTGPKGSPPVQPSKWVLGAMGPGARAT